MLRVGNVLVASPYLTNILQQRSQNRFLFTDRFLGLTTIRESQEQELAQMQKQNTQCLQTQRSRILASADQGVVLSRDLDTLSTMTVDNADIVLYQNAVLRFLELSQASKISQLNAGPHIYKLCQLHHLLNTYQLCMQLLEEESVKKVLMMNSKLASQSFLLLNNLLFKNSKFSDIIRINTELDMSMLDKSYNTRSLLTLTLLALIKADDPGTFSKATDLLNSYSSHRAPGQVQGRLAHAYAWLACKDGNHAVGYETVHSENRTSNNSLQINLQVFSLLELGRTEDAVAVLDRFIQTRAGPERLEEKTPVLCRDIIQKLVTAVKDSEDQEIIGQLRTVFSKLDTAAEITDEGIEDLLVIPMDSQGSVQRNSLTSMQDLERKYRHSGRKFRQ